MAASPATKESIMRALARPGIAALAAAALTLAGCATMNIGSFVERGANLAQYRTFAWGPADRQSTGDPRLDNNPFFADRLRSGVETRLMTRGMERSTSGAPDLLLHFHASVTQEFDVHGVDQEYGYCREGDCRPYVYDAGSIVIDLVDARTKALVWRGWSKGSLDGAIDDQLWMERTVDEAVRKIMQELPPRL
jgi:hypothetical protein